jgi:HlyD family secretion protein
MSGTVIDLNLQPGQRIAAGAPVITLADTSAWIVKTDNLTEMDVPAIQVGQKVKVTLDAIPGVTLNGEVTGINSRYEEKRGDITYTVTLQLLDNHPLMRWGMTAAVIFPS